MAANRCGKLQVIRPAAHVEAILLSERLIARVHGRIGVPFVECLLFHDCTGGVKHQRVPQIARNQFPLLAAFPDIALSTGTATPWDASLNKISKGVTPAFPWLRGSRLEISKCNG